MTEMQLMEKVSEVAPDQYQYLLNIADEIKQSPFCGEIVDEMDAITKTASIKLGGIGDAIKGGLGHMSRGFNRAGEAAWSGLKGGARGIGKNIPTVAGAALTGIGLALAGDLYDAGRRGITKTRNYRAMMDANPDLQEKPAAQVQSIFSTLHRFNPQFSGDPLVAGSFVRDNVTLATQDGAPGRIDMQSLTNLVRTRKELSDTTSLKIPSFFGGKKDREPSKRENSAPPAMKRA